MIFSTLLNAPFFRLCDISRVSGPMFPFTMLIVSRAFTCVSQVCKTVLPECRADQVRTHGQTQRQDNSHTYIYTGRQDIGFDQERLMWCGVFAP